MKLVELLAWELKAWPEYECADVAAIVQDPSKNAYVRLADDSDDFELSDGEWIGVWHNDGISQVFSELASDYRTAIITRADWEAEVARLAAVKLGEAWHSAAPLSEEEGSHAFEVDIEFPSGVIHFAGPIYWRDRIREIDITVEALEEERAGLVQQLEDEGFRLIDQAAEPVGDISDWRNWQAGDLLVVENNVPDTHEFKVGELVKFMHHDENHGKSAPHCESSDDDWWVLAVNLKFHSRPSA